MDVYDDMAEYYDLIYSDSVDREFYLREARNARGKVLEIACGTGRILLKLLAEGIDATGIDLSHSMLAELMKKGQAMGIKPRVFQADMVTFKLDQSFKLIIVPYRSFLHLKDADEREKALRNFRWHLENGGRLILHTYKPSAEEQEATEGYHLIEREELADKNGMRYKLDWMLQMDAKRGLGKYRIILETGSGLKRIFEMEIHFVEEKEMRRELRAAGFKNIKAYCGFDYSPELEGCREVLWFAER